MENELQSLKREVELLNQLVKAQRELIDHLQKAPVVFQSLPRPGIPSTFPTTPVPTKQGWQTDCAGSGVGSTSAVSAWVR